MTPKLCRKEILEHVEQIICKDRNVQHGPPEDTFQTIAGLWENYLLGRGLLDRDTSGMFSHDVAAMMVLFKIGRHASNSQNMDNSFDAAGYAAIMGELMWKGNVPNA